MEAMRIRFDRVSKSWRPNVAASAHTSKNSYLNSLLLPKILPEKKIPLLDRLINRAFKFEDSEAIAVLLADELLNSPHLALRDKVHETLRFLGVEIEQPGELTVSDPTPKPQPAPVAPAPAPIEPRPEIKPEIKVIDLGIGEARPKEAQAIVDQLASIHQDCEALRDKWEDEIFPALESLTVYLKLEEQDLRIQQSQAPGHSKPLFVEEISATQEGLEKIYEQAEALQRDVLSAGNPAAEANDIFASEGGQFSPLQTSKIELPADVEDYRLLKTGRQHAQDILARLNNSTSAMLALKNALERQSSEQEKFMERTGKRLALLGRSDKVKFNPDSAKAAALELYSRIQTGLNGLAEVSRDFAGKIEEGVAGLKSRQVFDPEKIKDLLKEKETEKDRLLTSLEGIRQEMADLVQEYQEAVKAPIEELAKEAGQIKKIMEEVDLGISEENKQYLLEVMAVDETNPESLPPQIKGALQAWNDQVQKTREAYITAGPQAEAFTAGLKNDSASLDTNGALIGEQAKAMLEGAFAKLIADISACQAEAEKAHQELINQRVV